MFIYSLYNDQKTMEGLMTVCKLLWPVIDGRNHREVLLFAGGSVLTVAVKYEEEKSLKGF